MAVDMFLKLDGIEGESKDAKHKGELDIESFSFGASNPGSTSGGTGGGAGQVSMNDFSFTTQVSKASPKLFLACASGQHLKTAVLSVRKAGGQQQDFLKVTLSDVTVSGYHEAASEASDVLADHVTMGFAKIQVSYSGPRPDGALDTPVTVGWDLKKNAKF
ncbi:MAG TPA: type VI secretion system tube protein Hcp [Acidimicrobiales bacterium]|nr:type VI secretion system tube protein Hcp [Acidimicrobiales bacterium]